MQPTAAYSDHRLITQVGLPPIATATIAAITMKMIVRMIAAGIAA
jgi:hypothetical protein